MKKKLIAVILAVLLIFALPLSVNAFSDYFHGTKSSVKNVTCPECGTQFAVTITAEYTVVHGQVQSYTVYNTTAICPECGHAFVIKDCIVKINGLPGIIR